MLEICESGSSLKPYGSETLFTEMFQIGFKTDPDTALKVVTSEKIDGSGVISTLGTWYGGVEMGVLVL